MTNTPQRLTFLILGATGGTGKYFITHALNDGHIVRALVRSPDKLPPNPPQTLQVWPGSITDPSIDTDSLLSGVDYVISMLGDKDMQKTEMVNLAFIKRLVPSMRKNGVKRFLYQAGGMTRPPGRSLSPILWLLRNTIARDYEGQHRDNEAVLNYLATEANDIEWIGHRAAILSDGPSKGKLQRSDSTYIIGNFRDCAEYSYRLIREDEAVHTCHFSVYE